MHPLVPATHLLESLQLLRLLQLLPFLLQLLLLQDLVHKLQLVLVQRPVLACSGGAIGQSVRWYSRPTHWNLTNHSDAVCSRVNMFRGAPLCKMFMHTHAHSELPQPKEDA